MALSALVGTARIPRTGERTRRSRLARAVSDNVIAYAFMAGAIACFALFSWYPLVRGILLYIAFAVSGLLTAAGGILWEVTRIADSPAANRFAPAQPVQPITPVSAVA